MSWPVKPTYKTSNSTPGGIIHPTANLLQQTSGGASASSGSSSNNNNSNNSRIQNMGNSSMNTPRSSNNTTTSQIDVFQEIIFTINNLRIRLIAFDFDQTIVSIHTGGIWPDSPEKLAEFVRPQFKYLIPLLLECDNLFIAIVTYSPQERLIFDVLRIAMANIPNMGNLLSRIIIKGNTKIFLDKHGLENCYSNGKEIHINECIELLQSRNKNLKIENREILLIDDDYENIRSAIFNGHFAYQINQTFNIIDLLNYLKEQLAKISHK